MEETRRATHRLLTAAATLMAPAPATAAPATFANPVSAGVVDTFPDPAMIRGKAGALRIGLISMNATGATARFDYVRTYALAP